jgi:adenylate kinase
VKLAQVCGAPGVGKTTLLEALGSRVLQGGALRSLAESNKAAADTGWLDDLDGSPQWREVVKISLRRATAIQSICSIGLAVDAHMPLQRAIGAPCGYIERAPLPDVCVFCLAPVEVIEQRLAERPHKPGRVYDTLAAIDDVNRALDVMTRRSAPVLVLDMTQAVEFNATTVLAC